MCTAISVNWDKHIFGRTLDLARGYGEEVVILPRRAPIRLVYEPAITSHSAIMGMAHVHNRVPLYYDGVNETGLAMAALNFPTLAVYNKPRSDMTNLASFELIPYVLSRAGNLAEAVELLGEVNITDDNVAGTLPTTPLHYIIADRLGAVTVEPTEAGLSIYDNTVGVMTNSPDFPYHMTRLTEYMSLSPRTPENEIAPDALLIPPSGGYGAMGLPGDYSSVSRFVRAVYARMHTLPLCNPIVDFFHVIDTVNVPYGAVIDSDGEPTRTLYTSAIDTERGVYYYKTYSSARVSAVRFEGADLDGSDPIRYSLSEVADLAYQN